MPAEAAWRQERRAIIGKDKKKRKLAGRIAKTVVRRLTRQETRVAGAGPPVPGSSARPEEDTCPGQQVTGDEPRHEDGAVTRPAERRRNRTAAQDGCRQLQTVRAGKVVSSGSIKDQPAAGSRPVPCTGAEQCARSAPGEARRVCAEKSGGTPRDFLLPDGAQNAPLPVQPAGSAPEPPGPVPAGPLLSPRDIVRTQNANIQPVSSREAAFGTEGRSSQTAPPPREEGLCSDAAPSGFSSEHAANKSGAARSRMPVHAADGPQPPEEVRSAHVQGIDAAGRQRPVRSVGPLWPAVKETRNMSAPPEPQLHPGVPQQRVEEAVLPRSRTEEQGGANLPADGRWADGTPLPAEPDESEAPQQESLLSSHQTRQRAAPSVGKQTQVLAPRTAHSAAHPPTQNTGRSALPPREAVGGVTPVQAAQMRCPEQDVRALDAGSPQTLQEDAQGYLQIRQGMPRLLRSTAARAADQVRRAAASAAAARAVRKEASRTAASLSAGPGPGRVVIALCLISVLAMVLGLTAAFVGAACGSARAAGGAGYMDLAVVQNMKRTIGAAFVVELAEQKQALLASGATTVRVRYNPGDTGDGDTGVRLDNWNDVLAVWLAKNGRVLTQADTEEVRQIYFALNPVSRGPVLVDGENITAFLDVRNLRAQDAAAMFALTGAQMADIESWISPVSKDSALWTALLGSPVAQGAPYAGGYLADTAPGSAAQIVLQEAQARVGWIYSQERRTQKGYADCSSLVASCYAAVGVSLSGRWPTAAEMGRYCDAHSCRVAATDAQPGDLVFWGGRNNGRYLGIYHVALYAGDGMIFEASPSAGGVVYRPVREQNPSKIIFYARPLSSAADAWNSASLPAGLSFSRTVVLSTTAYCEACDTIYGDGHTASGTYPGRGTVATSRTKQFAFGTKLYIPGYGYGTVEDTGGFSDGTIDLYLGHRSVCTCASDWGRKTLTVYVLQ